MNFDIFPAMNAEFIDVAIQAGEHTRNYRPSNGTEGDIFMSAFCGRCQLVGPCEIRLLATALDVDSPDYPVEWTYERGQPTCTAFVYRQETWQRTLDEISGIDTARLACA